MTGIGVGGIFETQSQNIMKSLNLLEKYNIRNTYPRREIVKIISSLNARHFSAEDILKGIKQKNSKISRATAYRAVKLFSQQGLLRPIELDRDFQMYELALGAGHHDHLYCVNCGKIIEFEDEDIEKLQEKTCQDKKFYPLRHTLKIVGLCKECKKCQV